jgi:hypothetical protein
LLQLSVAAVRATPLYGAASDLDSPELPGPREHTPSAANAGAMTAVPCQVIRTMLRCSVKSVSIQAVAIRRMVDPPSGEAQ